MKFKSLLSIALITTLVACGGAEERKAVYMEKAKASIEAGDFDKARIELKNVLQIDPKDGEAYFQLGSVFEQQKDYRKAYGNFLKAEELNPELLQNQAKLGEYYLLLMNEPDKAQEKIDLILTKEPANPDGLLLKAGMALKNESVNEAIAIAKKIIAENPRHTESIAFLAALYGKENKLKEAVNVLDVALKNNENNEKLNRSLAVALMNNKEYERAEVIYNKFLERNPDNKKSYDNLAAFYHRSGDKVKAEEALRASTKNNKDDADRQITLIKYIRETKGNGAAIDELKSLIASQKGVGKFRTALINLYLIENDKESAMEACNLTIADFSDEEAGNHARITLASLYISDKNFEKASDIVEEAVLISPNDPAVNFLRAKLAIRVKDTEKAIISLRIVIKEKPEDIDAYILLAEVYQLEKNTEQVISVLNTAYDNNKTNADSLLKLARYQMTRDIEKASKIIDSYIGLKESDYVGLSVKAAILNQGKEYSEAYKIAEKLMELYSDMPNGYLQAIPYYSQQGDVKKIISVSEKGYLSCKDNRKLLFVLSKSQLEDNKYDVVVNRIKAEISAKPDDAELKVLLAKVYTSSDKMSLAETVLNEVIVTNPGIEEPYMLLASLYQNNKDAKAVKSTLVRGVANVPGSTKIPIKLANIYELEGEYNKAIDIYDDFNRTKPDNLIVINNLASLLSNYGDGQASLELAKSLIPKLEGDAQPAFLDTIGWVHYKLGDAEKAIQSLKQSAEKRPDINVFNYHLGMAYKLSGDNAQAKIYLEKSLADEKPFVERSSAEDALKSL